MELLGLVAFEYSFVQFVKGFATALRLDIPSGWFGYLHFALIAVGGATTALVTEVPDLWGVLPTLQQYIANATSTLDFVLALVALLGGAPVLHTIFSRLGVPVLGASHS